MSESIRRKQRQCRWPFLLSSARYDRQMALGATAATPTDPAFAAPAAAARAAVQCRLTRPTRLSKLCCGFASSLACAKRACVSV